MKIIQHDFRQSTPGPEPIEDFQAGEWWHDSHYVGRPSLTRAIAIAAVAGLLAWWAMYELLCWAFSS